ncbi:MAG: MATE family efflux transporter, partial [Lachnospiraceae bacterium]|nr:MATE family efflux transporter [Lachnospiraceae bacterium]
MKKNSGKNMTAGSPMKLILGFSLPLLAGFVFQQFYNMVDTIIVGRFIGTEALAGVGSTGAVNFLIVGFCIGLCSGFAVPVAHRYGAGDYAGLRRVIANAAYLTGIFAVFLTLVVSLLTRRILILMKTPEDVFDYAYTYILIIFLGIPSIMLYNLLSGILRSIGDSRTPLYFLLFSSIMNIGLDLLFILVIRMGVAGAAVATVVSQFVSGLSCLAYMLKKYEILRVKGIEWSADKLLMNRLLSMGIPMGLQFSITAIGSVILQSSVNTLGSLAVASITAANKVSMLFCCAFDALGTTMATYGGQNVGAKRLNRLNKGLLDCSILGAVYSVAAFTVMYFFGDDLIRLFVNPSELNPRMVTDAKFFLTV